MNRTDWLKEKRRETEEGYDTLWAPQYGEKWGVNANLTHQQFMQKFLGLLTPHSTILDAACGAGRYWSMLLASGHTVYGIDQSQGMLKRGHEKFPDVQSEKMGLQEMNFKETFDAAICMDAMEHIFPEDWLLVLKNIQHAIKPHGYFYFTVEMEDENEIEKMFKLAQEKGLPVIYGEWTEAEAYHFYPKLEQVQAWAREAGFHPIAESFEDLYQHFLVQKNKAG